MEVGQFCFFFMCSIWFQIIIPIYFSEHRDYFFWPEFACFIRAFNNVDAIICHFQKLNPKRGFSRNKFTIFIFVSEFSCRCVYLFERQLFAFLLQRWRFNYLPATIFKKVKNLITLCRHHCKWRIDFEITEILIGCCLINNGCIGFHFIFKENQSRLMSRAYGRLITIMSLKNSLFNWKFF